MLEIDVFTLFPHWFSWLSEEPAVQRALNGPLTLRFLSYRDYSPLPHAQVDDAPFGGGAGMLLRVDAVASAVEGAYGGDLESVRAERRIVALDPGGRRFDDAYARELAAGDRITLLCGRYEGFDARALEHVATESLSLGPFVVSGGEPVAMAVVDALARLLPGSLADDWSSEEESFAPALDGRARVPALHAPRRVARARRAGGAALRPPRAHRGLAPGAGLGPARRRPRAVTLASRTIV